MSILSPGNRYKANPVSGTAHRVYWWRVTGS